MVNILGKVSVLIFLFLFKTYIGKNLKYPIWVPKMYPHYNNTDRHTIYSCNCWLAIGKLSVHMLKSILNIFLITTNIHMYLLLKL